jgi:hypothetical protein
MTNFASITAYAIAESIIQENAKILGICIDALDDVTTSHMQINEISSKLFVVFAFIGESKYVVTSATGEIKTFKSAGSAIDSVKLSNPNAHTEIKKLAAQAQTTKKLVAAYKQKKTELISAVGNLGLMQMQIDSLPTAAPELVEMLERKDAVTGWSASVTATLASIKQQLAAVGVDVAAFA